MKQDKYVIQKWLQIIIDDLATGEELLLPAKSKLEVKEMLRLFTKELRVLAIADPIKASQLLIAIRFKDHRHWLVVKKVAFSPFIGFQTSLEGTVDRVEIASHSDKQRWLLLIIKDGYSIKDIEEIEGDLSKEELNFLKAIGW